MTAATLPDVDAIEALDFEPNCDVTECDTAADWMGRGTCPNCGGGIFRLPTGERVRTVLLCDPHHHLSTAQWERKLDLKPVGRCGACKRVRPASQARDSITWQRIR